MRSVIIGDIHGCNKELCALLDKVKPEKEDQVILLGDLFDRGPESWEVFHTVKSLHRTYGDQFVLLRGNHEDYLLQPSLTRWQRMVWENVGRQATVNSFTRAGETMEGTIPWFQKRLRLFWKADE